MKEIKAYVRISRIDPIVHGLKHAGFAEMSIIHVREVGEGIDPTESKLSIELSAHYAEVVKIELVCSDERVEQAVAIIECEGHTGRAGDGIIYVSPVDMLIKIRTGERGTAILAKCPNA